MSHPLAGFKHTPETRAKMREGQLRRLADNPALAESLRERAVLRYADPAQREAQSRRMVGNRFVLDAPVKGDCVYCGDPAATTHDHVLPVSRGGDDSPANLVIACLRCNTSKNDRTLDEWLW